MTDLLRLRAHLAECFEPDFRIVGNTTQREIVQAIDAAQAALIEVCEIADRLADLIANNNPYAHKLERIARIAELRKIGSGNGR